MQVWVLMSGEFGEGGAVCGVYATRELGRVVFTAEAAALTHRYGSGELLETPDGSLQYDGSGDWVSLVPHVVVSESGA